MDLSVADTTWPTFGTGLRDWGLATASDVLLESYSAVKDAQPRRKYMKRDSPVEINRQRRCIGSQGDAEKSTFKEVS